MCLPNRVLSSNILYSGNERFPTRVHTWVHPYRPKANVQLNTTNPKQPEIILYSLFVKTACPPPKRAGGSSQSIMHYALRISLHKSLPARKPSVQLCRSEDNQHDDGAENAEEHACQHVGRKVDIGVAAREHHVEHRHQKDQSEHLVLARRTVPNAAAAQL